MLGLFFLFLSTDLLLEVIITGFFGAAALLNESSERSDDHDSGKPDHEDDKGHVRLVQSIGAPVDQWVVGITSRVHELSFDGMIGEHLLVAHSPVPETEG